MTPKPTKPSKERVMKIERKFVDATPDGDYALRILRAYREDCDMRWADNTLGIKSKSPIAKLMNNTQKERAKELDKAIKILEDKMTNPKPNMESKKVGRILQGLNNILHLNVRFIGCNKTKTASGRETMVIVYPIEEFFDAKNIIKEAKSIEAKDWYIDGYDLSWRGKL